MGTRNRKLQKTDCDRTRVSLKLNHRTTLSKVTCWCAICCRKNRTKTLKEFIKAITVPKSVNDNQTYLLATALPLLLLLVVASDIQGCCIPGSEYLPPGPAQTSP